MSEAAFRQVDVQMEPGVLIWRDEIEMIVSSGFILVPNLVPQKISDFRNACFYWWARQDSNLQPDRYERRDTGELR